MLSTGRLVGAALAVCAAFIFFLDMTPVRGAADGAAYGVVVAIAGYFGRRVVIYSAALAGVLTVLGPLLGAEGDETLIQIFTGRAVGLTVIAVVARAILHLIKAQVTVSESEQESSTYHRVLLKIAAHALLMDKPFKKRLEVVTELTAETLHAHSAAVSLFENDGGFIRTLDIWDAEHAVHFVGTGLPINNGPEFQRLMEQEHCVATEDVTTSPFCMVSLDYFARRNIRAVLHSAALYRDRTMGALVVTREYPHRWTEREIAFGGAVSNIVALIFAIHQSERTLQHLDLVSQGIFVESKEGEIEYANSAARVLAGCSGADCPAPALPFALPPLSESSDHHQVSHNGRDLEVHRKRLPDEGILIRVDDVTERNAALAETKRMETRLEQSAKLQAMGQLAAGVAHDFNNLLGAIMGFAQLLAKALRERPTELTFAERILGVCKKGQGLTQEVLAFARTSSVERSPTDLALVLGNSVDVICGEDAGTARLSVEPSPDPLPVLGNSVQLMQLIQNLVVNAKHACEGIDGCVTVSAGRATPQQIYTLLRSSDTAHERLLGQPHLSRNYCFLRVADNGHGIPPEILDRIFEPFFTTKGRRQGSGLGLAVVHGVVESHGGCCHVRSEPGKGTTFSIYLPLLDEQISGQTAAIPEQARAVMLHGTEKILIVDDDVELADALVTGLEQLGYGAVAFDDPLEALTALRAHPDDFDVLVTDHFMPKMHGTELVSAVRTTHTAIKIVLCSGANMPGLEQAALTAGADAFLRKPFTPEEVAYQIRTLLGDKAVQAA